MESSAKILSILERLVQKEQCVLTYDQSLVDQLPCILKEQHNVAADDQIENNQDLVTLFKLLTQKPTEDWHIQELPSLIRDSGLAIESFSVKAPHLSASMFDRWTEEKADQNLDSVLTLQKDLGMGQYNSTLTRHSPELEIPHLKYYLRSVISPPASFKEKIISRVLGHKTLWEYHFSRWRRSKILSGDKPTLSIGPRWITEVRFFREVVGLNKHIGLDLFSDDSGLVIAGDMHQMPFENNYFNFIFMKNVIDKSYNIRTLVEEIIRVIEPGGIVVVDQVCGYGRCNPLTRTDIQRSDNLLKLFQSRCKTKILVCQDIDISGIGDTEATDETRNNARLAFQILSK